MIRTLFGLTALTLSLAGPASAQERDRNDNPKLRAALHELREARTNLSESKDTWPAGYRERALASTQEAINTVRTILAVKDVNTFKGIDRDVDFYKKFDDHPRLRAALEDLRDARDELRSSKGNFGNLKEKAIDDIDQATGDIVVLIRYKPKR